jgi:1-deoxy-D-xylulose-5-phosphate reductoisomerase
MKKVCLLGATGSIGIQTLEVCRKAGYEVTAVTADRNYTALLEICREFSPGFAALNDFLAFEKFNSEKPGSVKSYKGMEGIVECVRESGADIVVNAITGSAGITPMLEAVKCYKRVALANKESLVAAGSLIMPLAKECGCEIIPVDSEHSAIFQCIGDSAKDVKRIILTASGGPFRGYGKNQLENVTPEMALKHPNWSMGSKITVDSATLMNKGLEVIEAHWLFNKGYDGIDVVIHPQSIVHSMVEFKDKGMLAQMGPPDMRIPIQYALTYPKHMPNDFPGLDIIKTMRLDFEKPDTEVFRCLDLAYEAGRAGGTMPCAMNAANEEAVEMFLQGQIRFSKIAEIVGEVMEKHDNIKDDSIEALTEADLKARKAARLKGGRK